MDKCIKKIEYIHTIDYYSALKIKKEIMPYVTTWVNFEDIMPIAINQSQKEKCYMILFI